MRSMLLLPLAFATACDATSPVQRSQLAFGLRVAATGAGTATTPATTGSEELIVTDGTHELVFTSVDLVLAEIELKKAFYDGSCPIEPGDDSCEEIDAGPALVSLPLDGSVTTLVTVEVPANTYDEIEFEIDRPGDDTQADADFVVAHPEFAEISIRAIGTFDGAPFEYAERVQADQEIELSTPLVIEVDQTYGLTLTADVAAWFVDPSGGALVDPSTAEDLVEETIEDSFEAFGDDDGDGIPNGEDSDNSG